MIFLVYGQQKSASTFLANLARQSCFAAGSNPDAIKKCLFTGELEKKRDFWDGTLSELNQIASQLNETEHTSVKTHSRFQPCYATELNHPQIKIMMSYRHPGDAALSAYEAGEKARQNNLPWEWASLMNHRDAIDAMADFLEKQTIPWLKSGLATAFDYDTLTRNSEVVIDHLAQALKTTSDQLMAYPDLAALLEGKTRVYNFNKGIAGRHQEVFSQKDLAYLEERCGPFTRFCNKDIGRDAL